MTMRDTGAAAALRQIAALASETGGVTPAQSSSLPRLLARLEHGLPSLSLSEQTRCAIDLHAIHARLTAARAGRAAHAQEVCHANASARVVLMLDGLAASSARRFEADRARIQAGGLRGSELCAWLAHHPPEQRDMAVEHLLGVVQQPLGIPEPHRDRVGYIPSGIAPIVQAVRLIPVGPHDTFVDVGSGLGKVAMAVHLLSGAQVRGIELSPELVAAARRRVKALGLDAVAYEVADAQCADFSGASVVFLYLPFTGATLAAAMRRVELAARERQLVVCALGFDLGGYEWLRERATDELWLSIYDSCAPGATPGPPRPGVPLGPRAEAVGKERSF